MVVLAHRRKDDPGLPRLAGSFGILASRGAVPLSSCQEVWNPTGVRRDPITNELLVVDATARKVFRLGAQFGDHFSLTYPHGANNVQSIAREQNGDFWSLDRGSLRAYRIDPSGTFKNVFLHGLLGMRGI
ncbi:hypothetical protein L6R52_42275, partial [Myxococcota bacterium]|nr:hypothetical protein [Myxococcota bacterium]